MTDEKKIEKKTTVWDVVIPIVLITIALCSIMIIGSQIKWRLLVPEPSEKGCLTTHNYTEILEVKDGDKLYVVERTYHQRLDRIDSYDTFRKLYYQTYEIVDDTLSCYIQDECEFGE